jgi:transcriptional regulator with XRE-family HTH domain
MGRVIARIRHERGIDREELAGKIEESLPALEGLERGEVDADWATLRIVARALELRLDSLVELAEEAAPGEGGKEWRRWSRAVDREPDLD